jgi:long-chain acyl-CoA synthetase
MNYKYFYDLLAGTANNYPDKRSFYKRTKDGKFKGITFREVKEMVDYLAAGLIRSGLAIGDRILFLCDSSVYWCLADCAIISAGGVSVPRGTDVTDDDITFIGSHSESKYAFVQTEKDKDRLDSLASEIPMLKNIYVIETNDGELSSGPNSIGSLISQGKEIFISDPTIVSNRVKSTNPKDLATLIYTSGTTGTPKGVMLNQEGWIFAIHRVLERMKVTPEDRAVSLLPPWHAFERGIEYAILRMGMEFLISDISHLREDLKEFKPTIFPSVPRIWESVYNGIMAKVKLEKPFKQNIFHFFLKIGSLWFKYKSIVFNYDYQIYRKFFIWSGIRKILSVLLLGLLSPLKLCAIAIFSNIHKALGGKMRISISGGSALLGVVDKFLSAIDIFVAEGYGLTETSAVISIRRQRRPSSFTVGPPLNGYKVKIKSENGAEITDQIGEKGTLWVKSEQVCMGYYKRPELNEVVFDSDGFFDTGDLMKLNWRGELIFAGRAKDTIALTGGENIEPVPIEDHLLSSEYIDQAMVVGDEQKNLGALIVPSFDQVKADIKNFPPEYDLWNSDKNIRDLFRKEITRLISRKTGFKSFELIPPNCFYIMSRPFDPDYEMTRTLKIKRPVIKENLAKEIEGMYK